MDIPRPRLIASDLDGTLLAGDGQLSDRTVEALRAADEAGIAVVAATGRSHRTAGPRLEPAPVVRTAVCSNGATVFDTGSATIVRHRTIDDEAVADVLAAVRSAHPDARFAWETSGGFGWEQAFVDLAPPHVGADIRNGNRAHEVHERIDDVAPTNLIKLLVGHPSLVELEWLRVLEPVLPGDLSVSTSGAAFVEVTGPGVDKASTLALVCDDLGIGAGDVLAFGDHANDVAMLEWAGTACAPANARSVALDVADHVVGHHDEDGVAVAIESVLA
ncbi:MAG: Cof-type HAD-IIB family hydrolase [Actinomycetota bacterium]